MKKQIWKYELSNVDSQTLKMPHDYDILSIDVQHGIPCVWVLVSPLVVKRNVHIEIYGMGHNITNSDNVKREFIGTYQLNGGALVFHAFEVI